MNKIIVLPGIALTLFFAFACTMPSEVEVTGSPSLKFAANMNFGDYFDEMTGDVVKADGDTKTIPCTNPSLEYKVFVMRMEIFKKENYRCEVNEDSFDPSGEGIIVINGEEIPVQLHDDEGKYVVLENEKIISESEEPYTMTFKGLEDYLEGFEFIGIHSKIYIYGTQLAEAASIDLYRTLDDETDILMVKDGDITQKISSGVEFMDEFHAAVLPPGGAEIDISDIINSGGDLALKYKIYLPEGAEIDYEWVDDPHTIVAEIIIWLPMTFDSIQENAKFKFPSFFNGIGDVLKSLSGTGIIEDLKIKIVLDPLNPFGLGNGSFVISDDNYGNIQNPVDEHSFSINLSEDEIDYINKNPFDPSFYVLYPDKNSFLEIPKEDMMLTTISLNTELKFNAEF